MNNVPLSLYIHFPWCVAKCPYCDFNSHALGGDLPESQYVGTLIDDLEHELESENRRSLCSIFLGGGTPSLFSPETIDKLLTAARHHFDISQTEITIEANPGTFDQTNFEGYRQAGVNRISLGAQSFSDEFLKSLGRIHAGQDIDRAYFGARKAGFDRINLDLMYGLPGQSVDQALADLSRAIDLGPEHISWYQLTIEPNTVFHRFPPVTPHEDVIDKIMQTGFVLLKDAGYRQYEVSAFAQPGEEARHNLNYWQFGDYLGIGAGAHGKLSRGKGIVRTTKSRVPRDYISNHRGNQIAVAMNELGLEFLMNALRLNQGFELTLFEQRTGLPRSSLNEFLERARDKGLLEAGDESVIPTSLGRRYLNDLLGLAT